MRRAGGHLTEPFAFAGLLALAACSRPADAVPAAPAAAAAPSVAPAASDPAVSAPHRAGSGLATEATCTTAPLGVRVVAVRRESADSIRVELALANLAPAAGWRPGSPAAASVRAAAEALEGLSVLSADGRRRLFPLRGSTGHRVGSAVSPPVPGKPETFWTLFPAADGPVTILLPGFAPLSALPVAPLPGRPEP
jgi:hypothetical protein